MSITMHRLGCASFCSGIDRFRSLAWGCVATLMSSGISHAVEGTGSTTVNLGLIPQAAAAIDFIWSYFAPIWFAIPTIPGEIAHAAKAISRSSTSVVQIDLFKSALCAMALLVVAALPRWLVPQRSGDFDEPDTLGLIMWRFGRDVLVALCILGLAVFLTELFFSAGNLAENLGMAVIDLALRYRLAILVPAILFRPDEPALRLIPATDQQVNAARPYLHAALAFGLAFPALIPVWLAAGMNWPAGQALALLIGLIVAACIYRTIACFCGQCPGLWFRWRPAAIAAAALFWLVWSYGVVTLDFPFFFAVVRVGAVLTIALILDRFIATGQRLALVAKVTGSRHRFWIDFGSALRRSTNMVALSIITLTCAGWIAQIFPGWFSTDRLATFESKVASALLTLCLGYVLFEGLSAWLRAQFAKPAVSSLPGSDEELAPASRLATVMPILHGFLGVAILGTTALLALAKIGVDITPLLAGAGIFGLAVSFGSQSLVRDIVAGIFYMADDAFRLGEYIEAGRLKGTVERISLRSVRLRHQNGQIHTLPFGQLGSVTNYSRDWVTSKFNLRLARDVEIDVVRKTVKKIGQDLLLDEEFGKEFLQPLKLQGVADIQENALVLRFKFTVKPGRPTVVQRAAMRLIYNTFREKGIGFAANTVVVQNSGDPADAAAATGIAIHATRPVSEPAQ